MDSYSLELREPDGEHFVGDRASRTAFCEMLDTWRKQFKGMDGEDPLGRTPTCELGADLDTMLHEDDDAADTIRVAVEDYAHQLAHVTEKFMEQAEWQGVERIIIGGGFQQSDVGKLAVVRSTELLRERKVMVELRVLHHHPDDGGLIGWAHVLPPASLRGAPAFLAVDIGGTNARCGIVLPNIGRSQDMRHAEVMKRDKWSHANDDDVSRRADVVQGIADMLEDLIAYAAEKGIELAPFVGVACPGVVLKDGSIAAGTQNLPGNWESPSFHLPTALSKKIPTIHGAETHVLLHNDAVIQGLSETPFTLDVKRWGVLTVGTGLGNASFTNR